MRKFRPPKKQSILQGIPKISIKAEDNKCLVISFKYFDRNQGQSFLDWQERQILAKSIDTLANYCCDTLQNQHGASFKIYGDFPPSEKTDFIYPDHVPQDAEWASLHVQGKICIAGHVVKNVFYIVFLDKDHCFYKSKLKGT